MTKTPRYVAESCPHEIRPGTAICLHCRHAERLAAHERRKHYMLRSSVAGAVVVTLGAAGVLGATAIRGRSTRSAERTPRTAVARTVHPSIKAAQAAPMEHAVRDAAMSKVAATGPSVSAGNVAIEPAPPRPAPRTDLAPILPQGRSDLADGLSATRTDSVVVLSFDTRLARTRIPEKFERFVRATLPTIYGAAADSALARIPEGGLARQGDLIDELPTRGLRIPTPTGGTIMLFPMTRPGQDGPLVTRYRVLVVAR